MGWYQKWDCHNKVKQIGGKASDYVKDLVKIKFKLDDNLALNKQLKLPTVIIVVRSVFEDDGKFYPQIYLDKCLYEL